MKVLLGVIAVLVLLPVVSAYDTVYDTGVEEAIRVFYDMESPDSGTATVVYEFTNPTDDAVLLELSFLQNFPYGNAVITGVYDIPLGSMDYVITGKQGVSCNVHKQLLPGETYEIIFSLNLSQATQQTMEGWRFTQTLTHPFEWPIRTFEVSLKLPKSTFTLFDPIEISPGAEIDETDFIKTVKWTMTNVDPGEGFVVVSEFAPRPHMYAIAQAVSIIIVILAFIYIFIVKKGFPAPRGFVRTLPGEDKPGKGNVIGVIEELFREAKREVLITSPWIYYVDWFTSNVKQLTDRGIEVRILTWPSYERHKAGRDWVMRENKKQGFSLSRFLTMFPEDTARLNPSIHAKMVIVDREKVLTSSSNLTQTGLWENYETGIWIEDVDLAREAAEYFNMIWYNKDTIKLSNDMFNPVKLKKALGLDI